MAQVTELSPLAVPGKVRPAFVAKPEATPLIDGAESFTLEFEHETIRIQSDGENWWIL